MKLRLLAFFLFVIVIPAYAQQAMYVNQWYEEHTYYGDIAKVEKSINRLPITITLSLDRILKRYLSEFSKEVHFRNAQVINLEQCFKNNPPGDREGVVPAYEVHYYISIPSAGIKQYNIHVKLDQYGQLLAINWPIKGYHNFRDFKDTALIRLRALTWAENHNMKFWPYTVHFYFDHVNQDFVWEFDYYKNSRGVYTGSKRSAKTGDVIEVVEGKRTNPNVKFKEEDPYDTKDLKPIRTL